MADSRERTATIFVTGVVSCYILLHMDGLDREYMLGKEEVKAGKSNCSLLFSREY